MEKKERKRKRVSEVSFQIEKSKKKDFNQEKGKMKDERTNNDKSQKIQEDEEE